MAQEIPSWVKRKSATFWFCWELYLYKFITVIIIISLHNNTYNWSGANFSETLSCSFFTADWNVKSDDD